MRIYLCGPINNCTDAEASGWRTYFKTHKQLRDRFEFSDPMSRDYRGSERADYREIVELDKRDLRLCDIVLAMYDVPSVGTAMEILLAWQYNIPTLVIARRPTAPLPPWLRYHATAIVSSGDRAVSKVLEWSYGDISAN